MNLTSPAIALFCLGYCVGTLASGADISVKGTITPAACTARFINDTLDFGDIRAEDLSAVQLNLLGTRQVDYLISCDAPTAVATSWTDNRAGTSHGGKPQQFGLGLEGDRKIGHYELTHVEKDTMADGERVSLLVSLDGIYWEPGANQGFKVWRFGNQAYGFASSGATDPEAFSHYHGRLELQAFVAPTRELDLSKDVDLDGNATLSLVYL